MVSSVVCLSDFCENVSPTIHEQNPNKNAQLEFLALETTGI